MPGIPGSFERVAVPSAKVGLPEVLIGILPGAGGTQRLPRLIGPKAALEMITSGRHVPAEEAHRLGIVDEVAPEGKLKETAVAEKQGLRVILESHSTRSEAAGDELDGPTLAKMFRAEAAAADAIDRDPGRYVHYLVEEAGGLLDPRDVKVARILNAPPEQYTRERFDRYAEQLAIITGLWETAVGETFSYSGQYYTVTDSPALPKSAQQPRPPVLIGGGGAKRTPRLAARYADEFNVPFAPMDTIKTQFQRVRDAVDVDVDVDLSQPDGATGAQSA